MGIRSTRQVSLTQKAKITRSSSVHSSALHLAGSRICSGNTEGMQWEYKDKQTGELKSDELRLRIPFSPFSYVIREGMAARDLSALEELINAG